MLVSERTLLLAGLLTSVSLYSVSAPLLFSQAEPAESVAFEVASIKPSKPGTRGMSVHTNSGRLTASNASLQVLIRMAYQVKNYQLSGAPSWFDTQRLQTKNASLRRLR